jgi:hypothetical protein
VSDPDPVNCRQGDPCPRIFLSSDGLVISQGYDHDPKGLATPPAGERQHEMSLGAWRKLNQQLEAMALHASSPYRTVTHSAFRLEARQAYVVEGEEEEFSAFLRGEPVPSIAETSSWFRWVAESTRAGARWARVYVAELPLSDYRQYEIAAVSDNLSSGEDVRIVPLAKDHRLSDELGQEDFWLLDAETDHASVVLLDYDGDGRYLGWRWTPDPAIIRECVQRRDLALQASMPIQEFLLAPVGR